MDSLTEALDLLDVLLTSQGLRVEIVICGAFAIQMHGFKRTIQTYDIDSLKEISDEEVLDKIREIGLNLGLGPRWLNDQASTVSIPKGAINRARALTNWKSIDAKLISRGDLIKMKASAFTIRRNETIKDWNDLVLLKPTNEEIEQAIEFIIETNSPPQGAPKQIEQDFQESINDLKKLGR